MSWLAEGDAAKLKAVNELPVIEFFIMLNKKIVETKKQIPKANKGHS